MLPLLKLLKEGASPNAQVTVANALVSVATNQERVVRFIVESLGIPTTVQVLGDSPKRVLVSVANLVATMAEQDPLAQEDFVGLTYLLIWDEQGRMGMKFCNFDYVNIKEDKFVI